MGNNKCKLANFTQETKPISVYLFLKPTLIILRQLSVIWKDVFASSELPSLPTLKLQTFRRNYGLNPKATGIAARNFDVDSEYIIGLNNGYDDLNAKSIAICNGPKISGMPTMQYKMQ